MKKYVNYCDICGREITEGSGDNEFFIEFGYTQNVKHKEDSIRCSYADICDECFSKIKDKMMNLITFICYDSEEG